MKQAAIERVFQDWTKGGMGVVLKEKDADRRLVFFFDSMVGAAIVRALESLSPQRPQPHDLLGTLVVALGAKIQQVEITEQKGNTFYARIIVDRGTSPVTLDARPSDAIALATKLKAPIFVEDALFACAATAQTIAKASPVSILWPIRQENS
jgi:bifunctional DNase/RNase